MFSAPDFRNTEWLALRVYRKYGLVCERVEKTLHHSPP
jgi:hypothetical protein